MKSFVLAKETLGYSTSPDPSNADFRLLTEGSKNVLIDYQKKIVTRGGYTRLGAANTALTPTRGAVTWNTSTGSERPQRLYDDELEVYLGTVDATVINSWLRVKSGFSTTEKLRWCTWYNSTEKIDVEVMVNGDANSYEWNGSVAVISSVGASTITKTGTSTFAQNRAYANRVTIGSSTTRFDISNPGGTTFRYTYDGTGTDPVITAARFPIGMAIVLQAQNFNSVNNGVFLITGSGANYFEVTNAAGSAEVDKTIGTGSIDIKSVFICQRTGVEYGYTGGETTTQLTGTNSTTGLVAGDVLIQKVFTKFDVYAANRINHTIFSFENQIAFGSEEDQLVPVSKNTDYTSFAFSSPRVAGEGALLTLDAPTRAFGSVGSKLVIFAGDSYIYKVDYEQITVGSTLAETLKVKRLDAGVDQGALNQESVIPIGNSLAYLSNEVALRIISNPENLVGINPKTFSNPIKPDFDANDWTDSFLLWNKNILYLSAPAESKLYMLNFLEDADGKLLRFWNPPQILPIGPLSIIDSGDGPRLHGHSNSVPETYLLFEGMSDGQFDNMDVALKLPIDHTAVFAYNSFGKRAELKVFDEYFVEGQITPNVTELLLDLDYDFGGATLQIQKTIDGSDTSILEGLVTSNSLAEDPLAQSPLAGILSVPIDTRKFRVVFELVREDFYEVRARFSTSNVDQYWAIISHGANAELSRRRGSSIRK